MDKNFTLSASYAHLIVNTLEGCVLNSSDKLTVLGRGNFNILGTDDNINRSIPAESLVNTFKLFAENLNSAVIKHNSVENICLTDKVCNKCVHRLVVYILGRTNLLDYTVVHNNNTVAHGQSLFLIVSNIYKCFLSFLLDFLKLKLHTLTQFKVKSTERLVKQNDFGIAHKRSCNCNTLLLTARKLCNGTLFITLEVNGCKHIGYTLFYFIFRHLFKLESESHIIKNIEVGKQRIFLEYRVYISFIRRSSVNSFAAENDIAAVGFNKTADDAQGCGFTAA